MPVPSEDRRGALQAAWLVRVLDEVDCLAVVEEEMTDKDRKYGGRTITLSRATAAILEKYQKMVDEEFGQAVPYNLVLAIAIKRAIAAKANQK